MLYQLFLETFVTFLAIGYYLNYNSNKYPNIAIATYTMTLTTLLMTLTTLLTYRATSNRDDIDDVKVTA